MRNLKNGVSELIYKNRIRVTNVKNILTVTKGDGHACYVTSVLSDSATLWTVGHQSPLSMEFSRQEYWSGLLCPPPGDLPYLGIKLASLMSPSLADGERVGINWVTEIDIYTLLYIK